MSYSLVIRSQGLYLWTVNFPSASQCFVDFFPSLLGGTEWPQCYFPLPTLKARVELGIFFPSGQLGSDNAIASQALVKWYLLRPC